MKEEVIILYCMFLMEFKGIDIKSKYVAFSDVIQFCRDNKIEIC